VSYSGSVSVGIDIGTTSISAAVIDFIKRTVVDTYTIPYAFGIACDDPGIREQDARKICDSVLGLAEEITNKFDNVKSIGVTGQMHGIVYLDKSGNAASNLKTWQDKRGDKLYESGETYCQRINSVTGESIYTGYGFSTIGKSVSCIFFKTFWHSRSGGRGVPGCCGCGSLRSWLLSAP